MYQDIVRQTSVFEGVEAHYPLLSVTLADGGEPVRIWGQIVAPEYFRVLGARVAPGRAFAGDDADAAVISHALWQRRFGSEPSVIGRRVSLNRGAFTICGVAPPSFRGPDLGVAADFWVPMNAIGRVMPERPSLEDRGVPWLLVYARLKRGVTVTEAQAQLNVLARRLAQEHPSTDNGRGFVAEPGASFHPSYRGAVVDAALLVGALVALVLVVACANVANILLSRASGRRREIAIRIALGAGRARLIREMIAESTMLSAIGGAAGVALSGIILHAAAAVPLPVSIPVEFRFDTDGRVVAFAALLSLVTGALFGFAPALRATRPDLVPALKDAPSSGPRARWEARDALALVQISVSVVVLVVTVLFLHSLAMASHVDPGFRIDRLLLADIDPRTSGNAAAVMERLRTRVQALPGVTSASFSDVVPLGAGARATYASASGGEPVKSDVFQTGPAFFETLGMRILEGRAAVTGGEAVINSALAARLWSDQDPLGRSFRRDRRPYRVVGVVANARTRTAGEEERPCIYLPFLPAGSDPVPFGLTLAIQTAGEPSLLAGPVREALHEIEPALAVSNIRTMRRHIDTNLIFPRAGALVFGAFGAIAILLTAAGLYGVINYSVALRSREFGIRFAVGAQYSDVLRAVMTRGAVMAGTGTALGFAIAAAGTRVLRGFLYGVTPADPLSFAAAPMIVILVAAVACYLPARRAARVDPLVALRTD